MPQPLKVAVAGLGTVGAGVVRLLVDNADLIAPRAGRPIEVTAVSARDRTRNRGLDLGGYAWFDDPVRMAEEADAEVVVELIGGSDGVARQVCTAALDAGRHLVTANKALLALHGSDIAARAEAAGKALGYEAAVAGGIPIVKALREGLAGNRISRIYGVLNGTCNYILTEMHETGRAFAEVLAEAQAHGYAEADPGFDVDGVDTAHKLALLSSLVFGTRVDFAGIHIEGIRHITPTDLEYADELGYKIKLLGVARLTGDGVEQRVHPSMVAKDRPIARIDGVYNAVVADGDAIGSALFEGRGAGEGPTTSAVLADLVDIARGNTMPAFVVPSRQLTDTPSAPLDAHVGAYYMRLNVLDRPGVIADVAAALREENISIEALIQRARSADSAVPVVMTTHETTEAAMKRAIARIDALEQVAEPTRIIRIESF
jgi:homoserine dehydrogenase